jgi:hypothetical protein
MAIPTKILLTEKISFGIPDEEDLKSRILFYDLKLIKELTGTSTN